jgi:protein BCP1
VIQALTQYLQQKSSQVPKLETMSNLLDSSTGENQVGLILTERFINMPAETIPSMYKMLLEEVAWAVADKEPYSFTHYLVFSRTYKEVESKLDQEEQRPSKKKRSEGSADTTFYFHPEDEVLRKYAIGAGNFEYTKPADPEASDSKRAFQEMGIAPQGHMILLEASRFEEAVKAVSDFLQPTGSP